MKLHLADLVARNRYATKNAEIHTKQQLIIDFIYNNYCVTLTTRYKEKILRALNSLAYHMLCNDSIDDLTDISSYIDTCPALDKYELIDVVKKTSALFLEDIDWSDLENLYAQRSDDIENSEAIIQPTQVQSGLIETPIAENEPSIETADELPEADNELDSKDETESFDTHVVTHDEMKVIKEDVTRLHVESKLTDIWLKPRFPQFDVNDIWLEGLANGNHLIIRKSLPKVPKVQSDISITTDVDDMKDEDLLNLYPNTFLKTRYDNMYVSLGNKVQGVKYHKLLGNILLIEGYEYYDLIDNVVKYPQFYKLRRLVDGKSVNFFKHIEIDGQLHRTLDIWDTLPEANKIPRNIQFIKEYVIRRYLLERDVKHMSHKYPLIGSLEPFITLFCNMETYQSLGYTDYLKMAKQCVKSRVSFYYTRNPIVRRLLVNE